MISSLVFCDSVQAGVIPLANGYLLMSALSQLFTDRSGANFFHGTEQGRKNFVLSPLLPSEFWWNGRWETQPKELKVQPEHSWAFRIAFFDETLFDFFREVCASEAYFHLHEASFEIVSVSLPEENPMSRMTSVANLLAVKPAEGVQFFFATPTGFRSKRDNLQKLLPEADVLFPSLAKRWRETFGEFFDKVTPDGIAVHSFNLCSDTVFLKNGSYARGCVGNATYSWKGLDEERKRILSCLSLFSFYSGIGYKTSQGMGQAIPRLRYYSS